MNEWVRIEIETVEQERVRTYNSGPADVNNDVLFPCMAINGKAAPGPAWGAHGAPPTTVARWKGEGREIGEKKI